MFELSALHFTNWLDYLKFVKLAITGLSVLPVTLGLAVNEFKTIGPVGFGMDGEQGPA